jgi:hypothetical protein
METVTLWLPCKYNNDRPTQPRQFYPEDSNDYAEHRLTNYYRPSSWIVRTLGLPLWKTYIWISEVYLGLPSGGEVNQGFTWIADNSVNLQYHCDNCNVTVGNLKEFRQHVYTKAVLTVHEMLRLLEIEGHELRTYYPKGLCMLTVSNCYRETARRTLPCSRDGNTVAEMATNNKSPPRNLRTYSCSKLTKASGV